MTQLLICQKLSNLRQGRCQMHLRFGSVAVLDINLLSITCFSEYPPCKIQSSDNCLNSKGFGVGVGMHRGSALGPLLFLIVMEAMSGEFGVVLP